MKSGKRMGRRDREREAVRARVERDIKRHEETMRRYFPEAYDVWQALRARPALTGIDMVIQVLETAKQLEQERTR